MSELPYFFIFTFREYAEGTEVKTFTMEDFEAAKALTAETGKMLLNPTASATDDAHRYRATLADQEEKSLDLPSGVAAVRELTVKLDSYENPNVTRQVVLKMEFDGKETVWCPMGDFFGSGIGLNPVQGWYRTVAEDGTMRCRWVMPYREGGKVSLHNLAAQRLRRTWKLRPGTGPGMIARCISTATGAGSTRCRHGRGRTGTSLRRQVAVSMSAIQ